MLLSSQPVRADSIEVVEFVVRYHILRWTRADLQDHPSVAGLGRFQAPLLAIGRYLESGALGNLELPDFEHKPLVVSLVVAHRRNLSRRVRAFMKWIENVLTPYLE